MIGGAGEDVKAAGELGGAKDGGKVVGTMDRGEDET